MVRDWALSPLVAALLVERFCVLSCDIITQNDMSTARRLLGKLDRTRAAFQYQ
jgi:hypothetical protein